MRPWAERVCGIPPEQVVDSSVKTELQSPDGKPVFVRLSEINFVDNKGDKQGLEWTQAGEGARLTMLVLHVDAEREYTYGPDPRIGTCRAALVKPSQAQGLDCSEH